MSYNRTVSGRSLLQERLNEIQMPSYERLAAQAHLARAEAIANLIVGGIQVVKTATKALAGWRVRTLAKIG
jgi:hypothetical protein